MQLVVANNTRPNTIHSVMRYREQRITSSKCQLRYKQAKHVNGLQSDL